MNSLGAIARHRCDDQFCVQLISIFIILAIAFFIFFIGMMIAAIGIRLHNDLVSKKKQRKNHIRN